MRGHTRVQSKPYFDLDIGLANSSYQQQHHHHHSRSNSSSTTTASTSQFQPPPPLCSSSYIPVTTSLSFTNPLRLAPPAEPTRVQLQRQRLQEQHARAPVSKAIPAIKTSAAFFASLRTNLRLHASPPPSPLSTPPSMRGSTTSLAPPSPLSFPALSLPMDETTTTNDIPPVHPSSDDDDNLHPTDPLAGVPELTSSLTTNEEERTSGLKLIADSVAQQRQLANRALLSNPFNLALLAGLLTLALRYLRSHSYDLYLQSMTLIGILMTFMACCRYATQGYLFAAEEINWEWVGESADILVTKFGDEVIAAAVVEWVSGESARKKGKKAWRGEIRAWTVRLKYRGKGVGTALLEEVVEEARKKGAEGLEFAGDHANSKRFLPAFYNSKFDQQDRNAREALESLMQKSSGGSPSRGGGGKRK